MVARSVRYPGKTSPNKALILLIKVTTEYDIVRQAILTLSMDYIDTLVMLIHSPDASACFASPQAPIVDVQ